MSKKEKKEAREKLMQESLELQNQLSDENKAYYQELLQYVREKNLFKDEKEMETRLLQSLKDLLEAQKNGKNATEFFGKDPESMGNELIDAGKKDSIPRLIQFFTVGVGIYLLVSVLLDLVLKNPLILGHDLINLVLLIPTIYFIFWAMSRTINSKKKWLPLIPLLIFVALHLLIPYLIPPFILIVNSNPIRIIMLMVSVFLIGGYYIIQKKAYEFFPPVIFFYVYSGLQFNQSFVIWQKTTTGRIFTFVLVLVVLFLMYFIGKKRSKKEEKESMKEK